MRQGFWVVLGLSLAASVGGLARADDAAQVNQILAIERAMAAAKSAPEILKYTSSDIVFDDLTPGEVRGIQNYGADITKQFVAAGKFQVTILKITAAADEHMAYAYSTQKFTDYGATPAQTISMVFRQADCYRREHGKWLMVYQNLSLPYDPKTGKVVFDEAP